MLQLSYVAEDDKGKIVGYVLAKMWEFFVYIYTIVDCVSLGQSFNNNWNVRVNL